MNWWTAAIYGLATVLALQGLLALMTAHRQASLRQFFEEELRRREDAASQAREPQPAPTGQKSKAA